METTALGQKRVDPKIKSWNCPPDVCGVTLWPDEENKYSEFALLLLYSYVVVSGHMLLAADLLDQELHALFICRTLDYPSYVPGLRDFSPPPLLIHPSRDLSIVGVLIRGCDNNQIKICATSSTVSGGY